MRKVVLAMISTLNGRLDKPHEWVSSVSIEVDIEFNQAYSLFDTILIGNNTYAEMAGYWPGAETRDDMSDANKSLAVKMNAYNKFVFTGKSEKQTLAWNNAEQLCVQSDSDIIQFIANLKLQSGGDIHLAGGAILARTFARLGLIDEYRFYVYPVVSAGVTWHEQITDKLELERISSTPYDGGVVGLYYKAKKD